MRKVAHEEDDVRAAEESNEWRSSASWEMAVASCVAEVKVAACLEVRVSA